VIGVLQLREGGDEQRVLLALDQDSSLQPKAVRVMIGVSSRSIGPIARPSTPDPADFDDEGVLTVDAGEPAERSRGRRHRDLARPTRRQRSAPK
jgi:hypothetical protein